MNGRKCRTFGIISIVCAGVSLFFGGALLDVVGFVVGIIALLNSRKLLALNAEDVFVRDAMKLAKIGTVLSLVAFIANMLTVAFLMPALLEGTTAASGPMF